MKGGVNKSLAAESHERAAQPGSRSPAARLSWAFSRALLGKSAGRADELVFGCAGDWSIIPGSGAFHHGSHLCNSTFYVPEPSSFRRDHRSAPNMVGGPYGTVKAPRKVASDVRDVGAFLLKCGSGECSEREAIVVPSSLLRPRDIASSPCLPTANDCKTSSVLPDAHNPDFDFLVTFVRMRRPDRTYSHEDPDFEVMIRPQPVDQCANHFALFRRWMVTNRAVPVIRKLALKLGFKIDVFVDVRPHGNKNRGALAMQLVDEIETAVGFVPEGGSWWWSLKIARAVVRTDTKAYMIANSPHVRIFLTRCARAIKEKDADGGKHFIRVRVPHKIREVVD